MYTYVTFHCIALHDMTCHTLWIQYICICVNARLLENIMSARKHLWNMCLAFEYIDELFVLNCIMILNWYVQMLPMLYGIEVLKQTGATIILLWINTDIMYIYIYMYTLNTISSAWTWVCQQWQGIRVWTLKKFGCLKSAPPTSTSCICYVYLLLACYALSHMLISCAQLNTSNSLREDHHTDLAYRFIPAQESNIIWNEMRYHNFQITIR